MYVTKQFGNMKSKNIEENKLFNWDILGKITQHNLKRIWIIHLRLYKHWTQFFNWDYISTSAKFKLINCILLIDYITITMDS